MPLFFHLFAGTRASLRSPAIPRLARQPALCGTRPRSLNPTLNALVRRPASTAAKPAVLKEFASNKMVYPERLLIYNAGAGRTAYIGFFKLVTIFIFAGGCLIVAPAVYYDPASSAWKTPAVLLAATVPMLALSATTAPFVNSIFLYLPPKARTSHDALLRYARSLAPSTRLDLATVSFRGSAKTTGCRLHELRSMPGKRWGIANIERVAVPTPAHAKGTAAAAPLSPGMAQPRSGQTKAVESILKAAQGEETSPPKSQKPLEKKQKATTALRRLIDLFNEPRNRFYVDPEKGSARSRAPGVVQLVVEQIERNGGGKIHL